MCLLRINNKKKEHYHRRTAHSEGTKMSSSEISAGTIDELPITQNHLKKKYFETQRYIEMNYKDSCFPIDKLGWFVTKENNDVVL